MSSKIRIEDARRFRVGDGFRLSDVDPTATPGFSGSDKDLKKELVQHDEEIGVLQEKLHAEKQNSLLIIAQGMDTSGKGGLIKRLLDPMSPLGYRVQPFGRPTEEEAAHDFLWRVERALPKPGEVVCFDRSHYEDVLVQKVDALAPAEEIERRYGAIVEFEQQLAERNIMLIKVMLHISKDFQKENLRDRLQNPEKLWKFDPSDLNARAEWDEYMDAYQIALERTSTETAPWYCIPGDNKDYARAVVKHLVVDALRTIDPQYPTPDFDPKAELATLESMD
ncbi:PPK2 family polyphosphate kinase [Corynebacterium tapiri]|uniref:PPK2 family polyphosphate--nucleotide phosphotransferase n=1 Tax=Corynebacterium tapiri TaxID=1448266 RepID=A0A5C4U3Q4_9CORY|nr:PPK2 family polyphosphate kinase [Corynebacterium tapiri]TNL97778.1 PPK2 family polyphosphate--nucleotide phosphotransferase [Corynebacterium tapiri]